MKTFRRLFRQQHWQPGWAAGILAVGAVLALAPWVPAMQFNQEDRLDVPSQNTISDSWYAAGQEIQVAGHLKRDAFLAANTLNFTGMEDQDLQAVAQIGTFGGTVAGDVRLVGDSLKVSTHAGEGMVLIARDLKTEPQMQAQAGLAAVAQKMEIFGTVRGKSYLVGQEVTLDGTFSDEVVIKAQKLKIGSNAKVAGVLSYYSATAPVILSGAQVPNLKWFSSGEGVPSKNWMDKTLEQFPLDQILKVLLAVTFLLVGLIWVAWMPDHVRRYAAAVRFKPWQSLGWGALILLGAPLAGLLLAITLVGIPLAMVLAVLYFLAIFFSKIGVGYFLGALVLFKVKQAKPVPVFLLGYTLLALIGFIPILGMITSIASIVVGVGALVLLPGMSPAQSQPETSPHPRSAAAGAPVPQAADSREVEKKLLAREIGLAQVSVQPAAQPAKSAASTAKQLPRKTAVKKAKAAPRRSAPKPKRSAKPKSARPTTRSRR